MCFLILLRHQKKGGGTAPSPEPPSFEVTVCHRLWRDRPPHSRKAQFERRTDSAHLTPPPSPFRHTCLAFETACHPEPRRRRGTSRLQVRSRFQSMASIGDRRH